MRRLLLVPALAIAASAAAAAPAPVTGHWLTEGGKAVVEIALCGPQLCGRIVRVLKYRPGKPRTDVQNPDASLRNRPIEGISILTGFTADGDRWRGRIYDPESGRTYRSELSAAGATLKVKGCIAMFCRTQDWARTR